MPDNLSPDKALAELAALEPAASEAGPDYHDGYECEEGKHCVGEIRNELFVDPTGAPLPNTSPVTFVFLHGGQEYDLQLVGMGVSELVATFDVALADESALPPTPSPRIVTTVEGLEASLEQAGWTWVVVVDAGNRPWIVWAHEDGLLASSYPPEVVQDDDDWQSWGRIDAESLAFPATVLTPAPLVPKGGVTVEQIELLAEAFDKWPPAVRRHLRDVGVPLAPDVMELADREAAGLPVEGER